MVTSMETSPLASYGTAALRHFHDAEHLATRGVYDGAGHLIGFAAECAVKHSVEALRPTTQAPYLHFPELAEKAKRLLHGRRKHPLLTLLGQAHFMRGWAVSQRYSDNGTVSKANYESWRADATRA